MFDTHLIRTRSECVSLISSTRGPVQYQRFGVGDGVAAALMPSVGGRIPVERVYVRGTSDRMRNLLHLKKELRDAGNELRGPNIYSRQFSILGIVEQLLAGTRQVGWPSPSWEILTFRPLPEGSRNGCT